MMMNKIAIFLFTAISLLTMKSNAQNVNMENSTGLGTRLINSEMRINSSTTFNNPEGILIGVNAKFTISKGAILTIATKMNVFQNRQLFFGDGQVVFESGAVEHINPTWFGAIGTDDTSDHESIQKAINSAINSTGVSVVYFPPGIYCLDKPLLALRKTSEKGNHKFFNLTLRGHQLAYNNPGDGKGGVSVLKVKNEIPFALGIQGARGVHIENMVFDGYIKGKIDIDQLIDEPSNTIYKQGKYAPLSAIAIDPFFNEWPEGGGYEGMEANYNTKISSSRIHIEGSAIQNFPTGVSISPNGSTTQGDSVAITFTRFSNLVNGVVICQTQSRNIVVDNCSFHRMKYAFNADEFGKGTGILPEVNNTKIADGVAWVYRANGNVSYGHFRNLYAEGLYGIGYSVLNKQPLNFDACVFKFRPVSDPLKQMTNPCILRSDNASFTGCTFTLGGGKDNIEPLVMDLKKGTFINCYFDSEPINIGNNLANKNISEHINSNYRKNKKKTSTWSKQRFSAEKNTDVRFDPQSNSHYVDSGSYVKGDFIFGKTTISKEPFENRTIYTVIGQVNRVEGSRAYFKSSVLQNKGGKLKMISN